MEVLDDLKTVSREVIITQWYEEVFPIAASYIKGKGGDLETAKELFQAAIVCYYEKQLQDDFEPEISDHAYLLGIVKKSWLKLLRVKKRTEPLGDLEWADKKERQVSSIQLLSFLKLSGQKCMDLLQSFYYERLSIEQLAIRFGYSSIRSATVQKYKCLEKVRDQVKKKSLHHEDFLT